jgi:hypothetical protein
MSASRSALLVLSFQHAIALHTQPPFMASAARRLPLRRSATRSEIVQMTNTGYNARNKTQLTASSRQEMKMPALSFVHNSTWLEPA